MTPQQQLIAIEQIKRACARRLRATDLKQWREYGDVHTEDAWSEAYLAYSPDTLPPVSDAASRVTGRQALVDAIRHTLTHRTPVTTIHHVHQPEIDFLGDGEASGIWPMEYRCWWTNGEQEERLHACGHYYETYRKVDDAWLIASRRMTCLHTDRTPAFFDRLK